ncbi:MAG: DUF222 domain-containing protein [Acidimicrobiales bacterium]
MPGAPPLSARRLHSLPVTTTAAVDGRLSAGQVKSVVANVTDRTATMFAEHEEAVVPTLVGLSVTETTTAMRWWAARAEASVDDAEPQAEPESSLHLSKGFRGRWALDGDLDALSGEVLDTALRLVDAPHADGEVHRSASQRRAQALTDICRFFLQHRDHPSGNRHRPHVNVIVRLEDLEAGQGGECADGVVLDGPSLAALVCDSSFHRVLMAGSSVLDYGTATRTISANLFNALVVRDRCCRFPGCDRPVRWTEVHHVVHVADGGPTCPSNCVLLCSRHHHRLHLSGWGAELRGDGVLEVRDPNGRAFTSRPPPHPGDGARPPPALFAAP